MANAAQLSPVVQVANFTKRYRKLTAVNSLDLKVQRGEIHGLIGPDGSGKSTLMKALAGVLAFEGGSIQVFETIVDSEAAAERIKGRIGFMPQGLGQNLYAELSVEENVDFFARLRLVPTPELTRRKARLLEMTHLTQFKTRPMKNLSGGMKQKLGLVCSLIHQPELIILDEPTTGVDPVSRRDFWVILSQLLHEEGTTAIISTAYMDEASRFQRVSLMNNGRLIAQGEPEALLALAPEAATLEDVFIELVSERHDTQAALPQGSLVNSSNLGEETGLAILAEDLVRDFDGFRAVDHLSFQVRRGEIFGLLGANGAGKTTAIKMLTGLLKPSSGKGRVAGVDMRSAAQSIKSRIGYMSQAFSLYEDLSALENLKLYGGIYGLYGALLKRRINEIIAFIGLEAHINDLTSTLPMGVRQRLALGCALLHHPQILFLDEPTSGVDPLGRRRFWDILYRLARSDGVTILVTTHYMSEAERCDHLVLMYAGRNVADASPAEMKAEVRAKAGALLELEVEQPLQALDDDPVGGQVGGGERTGIVLDRHFEPGGIDLHDRRARLARDGDDRLAQVGGDADHCPASQARAMNRAARERPSEKSSRSISCSRSCSFQGMTSSSSGSSPGSFSG